MACWIIRALERPLPSLWRFTLQYILIFKTPLLPKFGLVPEGADKPGAFTADATQGMGGPAGELPEIAGTQVRQLVLFPVAPEVFDGVKFRSIGWETLQPDFAAQALQVRSHQLATVSGHSVPDDERLAFDVTLEVFQEIDHLLGLDRTGVEAKVKVPPAHPGDGRELLPVEVELQNRGRAFGTPCAHTVWLLTQAAFVDED